MADKGYRRASFETELNDAGITLIRPTFGSEPPRPHQRFLRPFRQIIESVNQASAHASYNDSSRSPPPSGTTKPPNAPAQPAALSPTTTDPLELSV